MKIKLFCIGLIVVSIAGCSTGRNTLPKHEQAGALAHREKIALFEKAKTYLEQRDYANALINYFRAGKTGGDEQIDREILAFKNSLMERLNARALYDREPVEVGRGLSSPLRYMVYYTEGDIIFPAVDVPVTFEVTKGTAKITEKGFTNTSGVAECTVSEVESLSEKQLIVTADVFFELDGEPHRIAKLRREFTLQFQSMREQTMSFIVFAENIGAPVSSSTYGGAIEGFFIENGFSVLRGINEEDGELFISAAGGNQDSLNAYRKTLGARLLAFVHIEAVFSSKVSEGFYFARAGIVLNIIDTETNRVILNSVVEDVKGAGSTEEKAGSKAISEAVAELTGKLRSELNDIDLTRALDRD
jgi:hypothetical protein